MIVEVRSYRIKPGRREEFIKFFETRSVPALRAHGMQILGPLLDLENPNKFVWLRSFPSLEERDRMLEEIASLQENIDHIKEIVTMQQAYATMVGVVEPLDPTTLMDDAMRMNAGALARHDVSCVKDFQTVPRVIAEKLSLIHI